MGCDVQGQSNFSDPNNFGFQVKHALSYTMRVEIYQLVESLSADAHFKYYSKQWTKYLVDSSKFTDMSACVAKYSNCKNPQNTTIKGLQLGNNVMVGFANIFD
jgi:hypothetical protein